MNKTPRALYLLISTSLLLMASIGCEPKRFQNLRETSECKARLEEVWQRLLQSAKKVGCIPLTAAGQPDWDRIFESEVEVRNHSCPKSSSGIGYLFRKGLTLEDLKEKSYDIVIGMDASTHHVFDEPGVESVTLLFIGGGCNTVKIDVKLAEQWRSVLMHGGILDFGKGLPKDN